jgi:hypothetical protein
MFSVALRGRAHVIGVVDKNSPVSLIVTRLGSNMLIDSRRFN